MRLWTLALIVVGYLAGLYFYSRGFLLTRQTLRLNSSCADVQHPDSPVSGCWIRARYKRAIVLVIDALRFDFVHQQTGADISPYYHNRLTTIARLLEERKHQSLLLEFTADPPTTTLQRLKALTTGSLPTFIDAGANFAGTAIDEDNIIDQLVGLNRNITFLGDDTWTALFPTQFHRQFPFPSFDVKDLHTVDDGILAHLYDELDKPDWTLLVAHFLGVDHCGHKYGPSHPEMKRKLDQMDRLVANVTKQLADDTLLIVFGDHGMTSTGDHGGDSPDELAAALFLHSNVPLHSEDNNVLSAVAQVDLVPTLSLLLDFPTPYSSLGMIIPQVFTRDQQLAAAKANTEQVVRYAHSYSKLSGDSSLSNRLQPLLRTFDSLTHEELTVERCLETVRQMQQIFRDCWATFHEPWMLIGVLAILETFSWTLRLMVDEDRSWGGRAVLKVVTVVLELVAYFGQQEIIPVVLHMLLSLQLVLDLAAIVNGLMVVKQNRLPSVLHALPYLLVLLHAASFFSNSFVVYERDVIRYLTQTSLLLLLIERKNAGLQRKPGTAASPKITSLRRLVSVYFGWKSIIFATVALVLLRSGIAFAKCREEQSECVPSWLTASFQSIPDDADKYTRFLTALGSVALLVCAMRIFLQRNGHLDGHSFKSVILGVAPLLSFMAILVYWVSLWLPDNVWQHYQTAFSLAPPLVVYALSLILIILLAFNPLLINVVVGQQKRDELDESAAANKRKLFQHFKQNWADYLGEPTGTVFGLASAVSGPTVALLLSWTVVLVLLLGDGIVASVSSLFVVGFIALELGADEYSLMPVWSALCSHAFYALGHEPTFSAIPWHAAFVGVPGNFGIQAVPALLVVLSLTAGHVLLSLALPLLVVWRSYPTKTGLLSLNASQDQTEHDLLQEKTASRLTNITLVFLSLQAVKMMAATFASAVHKRHLMVWKIFAPKFIFEGISFIVTCCFVLAINLFIRRLLAKVPSMDVVNKRNR